MRMRAWPWTCLLVAAQSLVAAAQAPAVQVLGYAGLLGEWELTATANDMGAARTKEFSGPLTMKHVGFCSVDGPEEKRGEIRIRISTEALDVTLSIAGAQCSFQSRSSNPYIGTLTCSDRAPVPMTLWIE